jgi:hypothetical protein
MLEPGVKCENESRTFYDCPFNSIKNVWTIDKKAFCNKLIVHSIVMVLIKIVITCLIENDWLFCSDMSYIQIMGYSN